MEKTVILDAGHGGIDTVTGMYVTKGKRSPIWNDGSIYYEGVGNRDIVLKATKLLEKEGVTVKHTVDPLGYEDVPLNKRVKIANKHYLDSNKTAVLISVHSNGFTDENANGCEVYSYNGFSKSDELGAVWLTEFKHLFPDIKIRGVKDANFQLLRDTICPAVLIEPMFHTNERECRLLMQDTVREKIALSIKNAVLTYN